MDTKKIRARLEEERDRLRRLRGQTEGDAAGEPERPALSELSFADQHAADVGTEVFERSKEQAIRHGIDQDLADVERALRKLDEGTYGRCEACGREIGARRLEAVPMARYCVDDQQRAERQGRAAAG